MDQAGIVLEETSAEGTKQEKKSSKIADEYSNKSLDELNEMLENALTDEDYEKAAKLRDKITFLEKRKKHS